MGLSCSGRPARVPLTGRWLIVPGRVGPCAEPSAQARPDARAGPAWARLNSCRVGTCPIKFVPGRALYRAKLSGLGPNGQIYCLQLTSRSPPQEPDPTTRRSHRVTVHPRTGNQIPSSPESGIPRRAQLRGGAGERQFPFCVPGDRTYMFPTSRSRPGAAFRWRARAAGRSSSATAMETGRTANACTRGHRDEPRGRRP